MLCGVHVCVSVHTCITILHIIIHFLDCFLLNTHTFISVNKSRMVSNLGEINSEKTCPQHLAGHSIFSY